MELKINRTLKTVTLVSSEKIQDIMDELEVLLPNGAWREYMIIIDSIQTYPIYPTYPASPFYPQQPEPIWPPHITYEDRINSRAFRIDN